MTGLRTLFSLQGHRLLTLLLAVLGMHGLIPAGHMLGPSADNGVAITMCPVTHPLARAMPQGEMAHAAMDHAPMDHAPTDHAAMGHTGDGPDAPASSTAQGNVDCAFSALGSAAVDPGKMGFDPLIRHGQRSELPPLPDFAVQQADRLRPPLRAPPLRS